MHVCNLEGLNFFKMKGQNPGIFFFCFFLINIFSGEKQVVEGLRADKLFAFGDSYVDTGNTKKADAGPWDFPYGITFPGKPAGRYSDGFVSTDFIAGYLGIKTPIPYKSRTLLSGRVKYGLNFAYGGTGVFDTLSSAPNMTIQIRSLRRLIKNYVYTKDDLKTSLVLVSVAGNDYSAYLARNGSIAGLPGYITSVVRQLAVNLKSIRSLGVGKIAVASLQPLGCLPFNTAQSSFKQCNENQNMLVDVHNELLLRAVTDLNKEIGTTSFFILDMNNAFWTVLNQTHQGSPKFENILQPCCVGVNAEFSCGSVDENRVKKYTVCSNPKSKFFWDTLHPTQEGWRAVFSTPAFRNSLKQLLYSPFK